MRDGLNRKKKKISDVFGDLCCLLMMEYKIGLKEVLDLPLSSFFVLVGYIIRMKSEEAEQVAKQTKKGKKRGI